MKKLKDSKLIANAFNNFFLTVIEQLSNKEPEYRRCHLVPKGLISCKLT